MKLVFALLFLVLSFLSFSQDDEGRLPPPPDMARIKGNVFIDKYEVSNADYREYLAWLSKQGKETDAYKEALPDTLVWRAPLGYNEPYIDYYFRHPGFDNYPVVGISPQQANNYCNWRAGNIKAMLLYSMKLVATENLESLEEVSYIDSLAEANDLKIEFRLPTVKEWEEAAKSGNEEAIFPWKGLTFVNHKENPKANCELQCTEPDCYYKNGDYFTKPVDSFKPNDYGIYNMAGNVAEMVLKSDPVDLKTANNYVVLKGGSWWQSSFYALIKMESEYIYPDKYIGFRCVCEFF